MALPPPTEDQAYCSISALEAGRIALPDHMFITGAEPGRITHAPSLSFLITHSRRPQKFVFDLGIRRDWENYSPMTVRRINEVYACEVPQTVVESLEKGGLSAADIDTVCLSHCHWDHVGDTRPFTKATFVLGMGALNLLKAGYPTNPASGFAEDTVPLDRTQFLDETVAWERLGPFPRSFDFYGDGSLYIVDSPGHLPGHINVAARTSPTGGWVYLAADSAHHWKLVTGEAEVSVLGTGACAHVDKATAEIHLNRIKALYQTPQVQVILAHDTPFMEQNPDAYWPGKINSL